MDCNILIVYLQPLTKSTQFREAPNGCLLSLNTLWLCLHFVFNFKVKITILIYSIDSRDIQLDLQLHSKDQL